MGNKESSLPCLTKDIMITEGCSTDGKQGIKDIMITEGCM